MKTYRVAVLAGDGIGPELVRVTIPILRLASYLYGFELIFEEALVGGTAIEATGKALPPETLEICKRSQAIFFGAVGGKQWESLPPEKQPERAALLPLRKTFSLFANLRPVTCYPELIEASPLKPEIASGVDLLIVRELTGGIYFGQPKGRVLTEQGERAIDTLVYDTSEIERVATVAFEIALRRKKSLTLIDKANVLESSLLWRKTVKEIAKNYPEVELKFMYVDNAAMQLVLKPTQFDVLLCENLFGDILSDEAAGIAGSLGLLASASIGSTKFGLYEPAGGSAPDIAGKGIANPIAQILSGALMFEYSFQEEEAAQAIKDAIRDVLKDGYRTMDIAKGSSTYCTTEEFAEKVAQKLEANFKKKKQQES
ncbi:3-isopropylmalate dehydrogenase [Methylacidiphilum kamchatkense Kam1]|uniref:3-isopropylmalate dehydrogenase n=1 Tax=Methylacidiphilum kamchatkense Kam1 TaxID=1202785 RepID=A0A0C1UTW7_9BACT|nr:3-isopropylmalate dehydrogenase [Methylacidiphilum kamchatkense]KIE59213.1 3-isopropylmalate dehydrogenase [Methylacidiphilum kamchatkense Kam1]QDQ42826.1 3-isopropylmalate dehydrogenase [Methylacidiphilum kamchatkense Kam1]